jgi:hypothetical protein
MVFWGLSPLCFNCKLQLSRSISDGTINVLDAIQPLNNVILNVDIWSLDIKATPPTKVEILKKNFQQN